MRGYIDGFLTSPEGGFYATQDADLNAHEPGKPFVTGHEYYAMDDAQRRALGIPRVDTHEYGKRERARDRGVRERSSRRTGDATRARVGGASGEADPRDARRPRAGGSPTTRAERPTRDPAPRRQRGVRVRA